MLDNDTRDKQFIIIIMGDIYDDIKGTYWDFLM